MKKELVFIACMVLTMSIISSVEALSFSDAYKSISDKFRNLITGKAIGDEVDPDLIIIDENSSDIIEINLTNGTLIELNGTLIGSNGTMVEINLSNGTLIEINGTIIKLNGTLIEGEIGDTISDIIGDEIGDNLGDEIGDNLGDEIGGEIGDGIEDQIETCTLQTTEWLERKVYPNEDAILTFETINCQGKTIKIIITERDFITSKIIYEDDFKIIADIDGTVIRVPINLFQTHGGFLEGDHLELEATLSHESETIKSNLLEVRRDLRR